MGVSKRLRYEILRRDDFMCRYCHATDVVLTVEHVLPVALGGKDDAGNLVAACRDCNAGKSAASPADSIIADVQTEILRWEKAKALAAEQKLEQDEDMSIQVRGLLDYWVDAFLSVYGEAPPRPNDDRQSIESWLSRGVPTMVVMDHIDRVVSRDDVLWNGRWRWFAGCCWRSLRDLEDAASRLIAEGRV